MYLEGGGHKVRIYKEYHSVCPLVGIGTLPTHLSPASVPLPPEPGGGGHNRLRARGWGRPNSDDLRKSLALCLLCGGGAHSPAAKGWGSPNSNDWRKSLAPCLFCGSIVILYYFSTVSMFCILSKNTQPFLNPHPMIRASLDWHGSWMLTQISVYFQPGQAKRRAASKV